MLHGHADHPHAKRFVGEFWLMAADADLREGHLEDAERSLRRSAALLGDDSRLIGTEADLEEARGNAGEAARLLQQLLALDPESEYLKRRLRALE